MRSLLAATILILAVSAAPTASVAREPDVIETREVSVDDIAFVKLFGNTDFGYKYRVNPEAGKDLHLVEIQMIG